MAPIQLSATDDLIDICYDKVFKAVFTKESPESHGALSKLLSAVIGRDLVVLTITANEPAAQDYRDKNIRFDIACKAVGGECLDVEIFTDTHKFDAVRLEFYSTRLFASQDIRGPENSYKDLKETYQIAIFENGRLFDDTDFFHNFEYYDHKRNMSLGGRSSIITLELSKLKGVEERPVNEMSITERWGFYLKYVTDKEKRDKINEIIASEEGIAMASQVLVEITKNDIERARYTSELKYILDRQSELVEAKREGRQEGLQEGRQEGRLEILKLIEEGYSPEEIKERLKTQTH